MATKRIRIYPDHPNERDLGQVAEVLRAGGVIVYPTDSLYAFGCSLREPKAIERLRTIKGKSPDRFALIFADLGSIAEYCRVDNVNFKILRRNLPGAFTFILPASSRLPDKAIERRRSIGVRIPSNPIPRAIVEALGVPLVTTSVARFPEDEGDEYLTDAELIEERWGHAVELIVDGGIGDNMPTTLVDLSGEEQEILREGRSELK